MFSFEKWNAFGKRCAVVGTSAGTQGKGGKDVVVGEINGGMRDG